MTGAPSTSPAQFTGREDDGTGLYYYRARYYHPSLQRFVSEDSHVVPVYWVCSGGPDVGGRVRVLVSNDPREFNLYMYALNSPTGFVDRHGLQATRPWDTCRPCPAVPNCTLFEVSEFSLPVAPGIPFFNYWRLCVYGCWERKRGIYKHEEPILCGVGPTPLQP